MSPQDNSESEGFVYIDKFEPSLTIRDGHQGSNTFSYPVETDYVTVDNDNPTISEDQSAPMTPARDDDKQPMVRIEYFEPMLLCAFPEELSQGILMAPIPSQSRAVELEPTRTDSPDSPHSLLVQNSILLLECFFHFGKIYPKIGRDLMLYTVGKGCELSSVAASTLQRQISRMLYTLRESRMAFLQRTKHVFVLRAEDHNVRELARLVDRYINFKPEEPQEVEDKWHTVEGLWIDWQYILQSKGLRMTKDLTDSAFEHSVGSTGSDRVRLISEVMQAADNLDKALIRLEACGGLRPDGLNKNEKRLIRRSLNKATRWTERIKDWH